jgi:hypothetical protein
VVRWHYQWLIIHEFLVKTVGAPLVTDVLTHGPKHFKWRNNRYIPVEFSVAAYRFGHSQVRPSYRANFGTSPSDPAQQFFALIFDPAAADPDDPADLRGGRRAPRPFIDWQTFFDFGDGRVRRNMKIDTTLSTPLFDLMGQPPAEPTSLATRNLLRNLTMKVPSGQRVAKAMKLPSWHRPTSTTSTASTSRSGRRCGSTSYGRPRSQTTANSSARSVVVSSPR